ncbi:MAG TPA: flagellar hook-length control protein FliK, partial [Telluria sp.]|nr:flagellar hook-length control protein FliK [Telluria sp.]
DAATAASGAAAFQDQLTQGAAALKVDPQAAADAAAKAAAVALPAMPKADAKDIVNAALKAASTPVPAAPGAAGKAVPLAAAPAATATTEQKSLVKPDAPAAAGAASDAVTAQPADTRKPLTDSAALQAKPQAEATPAAGLATREAALQPAAIKEAPLAAPVTAQVQQASLQVAQAAGAVATDKISARVGTPAWDNQVGQKIVWMVAGKEQSASLTLNPPDMGPMQVVLSVHNDQASVTFSSAQPEVRQALENAMPKLREMMSDSGIALGNATVNAGMPDQRQAQGGGEQQRNGNSGMPSGRFDNGSGSASDAAVRNAARPTSRAGTLGAVDTFA